MSEKRFELSEIYSNTIMDTENCVNNGSHCRMYDIEEVVDLLNEMSEENKQLKEEKGYWKSKAMILLMQVRRLTPRMTAKEVIEFSKELEDE